MVQSIRPKRKRPWGAGVFSSQLGVVGSSCYPRGDFGGLVKSRVNSQNPVLAHHRGAGAGDGDGVAGLHDAGSLGVFVSTGASRDAEARDRDACHQGHDNDLEMRRAIGAVDRVVHGSLPALSACSDSSTPDAVRFNISVLETWGLAFRFRRGDHNALMRVERPRLDCRAAILAETNSHTITAAYTILWIQEFAGVKPRSMAGPRS